MNITITLTTTDWTKIPITPTNSSWGFSFRSDSDISFSEVESPTAETQIPIKKDIRFLYKRNTSFYVKWSVGNKIFLAPFEK
jgi:hypothetical protein